MKTIVIYTSQTGFTKRYAEWICEASGAECVEFKQAKKIKLSDYDAIIFGGWCMAGGVTKLGWFKNQIAELSSESKKIMVYMVGASPAEVLIFLLQWKEIFRVQNGKTLRPFTVQAA